MRDVLPDYALGLLQADEAAGVAAHVAECELCRAELSLLQQVRAGITISTPRVNVAAIVRALPMPPGRLVVPRGLAARAWGTSRRWQLAAASVVLLLGGEMWRRRVPVEQQEQVADSAQGMRGGVDVAMKAVVNVDHGISLVDELSDMSLDDLQQLLGQIDSVRTLPNADPESVTPVIATSEKGDTL